ncbi:MAG: hypothetical protein M3247_01345 [Thermoproteota archaeon]|nr:hypothetical protein [Thermoproteota archaeon]
MATSLHIKLARDNTNNVQNKKCPLFKVISDGSNSSVSRVNVIRAMFSMTLISCLALHYNTQPGPRISIKLISGRDAKPSCLAGPS